MTLDEFVEAQILVANMMTALSAVSRGASGTPAADLHYGIADLNKNADYLIRTKTLAPALLNVFELATVAGGTVVEFEVVRTLLTSAVLSTSTAMIIANLSIQMVLAQEIAIYGKMTFTSRDQVNTALAQIKTAFVAAIDFAADNYDIASRQALSAAMAAICQHLNETARPLPKMITYTVARVMTSLTLANRIYGDASRADELVAEGAVIQPAFMPLTGPALSS